MSQNKELKPNNSSSSSEETTSGSESDKDPHVSDSVSGSSSSSESDPPTKTPINVGSTAKNKRPPPPLPLATEKDAKKPKPVKKPQDPESGSDHDSNLPPKKPLKVVDNKLVEKDDSETLSTPNQHEQSALKAGSKEKEAKKETKGTVMEDESKKFFQRLWSEDDEIEILKGIPAYKSEKNGEDPVTNMGAFHDFIKKSLSVDCSRSQLVDKIRRLRKKYKTNVGKGKDGKNIPKKHEQKVYELSKPIWGSGTESKKKLSEKSDKSKGGASESGGSLIQPNGVDDKQNLKKAVETKMDVSRFVLYGGRNDSMFLTDEIVKAGMELVDGPRRAEMEEKWRKLREQELVLYVKRLELLREQALMVLEAIGSSGN